MKVRGYILANIGIAALTGLFNGPAIFIWDHIQKFKIWLKAKPKDRE